jgi:hypothetical protein
MNNNIIWNNEWILEPKELILIEKLEKVGLTIEELKELLGLN